MQFYLHKIITAIFYCKQFLLLLVTIRPKHKGIKVFGKPKFLGGPKTKFEQLLPILKKPLAFYSSILCLSAVSIPLPLLKILKYFGVRILVNQNGVYYSGWYSGDYQSKNIYLKDLNEVATHSFFQSEFALRSYKYWIGEPPKSFSILYNPVNTKKYFPTNNISNDQLRILFFTDISSFNEKLWAHFLNFITRLEEKSFVKPITVVILGRVLEQNVFERLQIIEKLKHNKLNIETHFDCSQMEVIAVLQSCHMAYHLVYNDVCPNKVLECMACGVWVVAGSAGGSAELVGSAGKIIQVQEGYEQAYYPDFDVLINAITEYLENPQKKRSASIARAQDFAIEKWYKEIQAKA